MGRDSTFQARHIPAQIRAACHSGLSSIDKLWTNKPAGPGLTRRDGDGYGRHSLHARRLIKQHTQAHEQSGEQPYEESRRRSYAQSHRQPYAEYRHHHHAKYRRHPRTDSRRQSYADSYRPFHVDSPRSSSPDTRRQSFTFTDSRPSSYPDSRRSSSADTRRYSYQPIPGRPFSNDVCKLSGFNRSNFKRGDIINLAQHENNLDPNLDKSDEKLCESQFGSVYSKLRMYIVLLVHQSDLFGLPLYTFNGKGLLSKPESAHHEYVLLFSYNFNDRVDITEHGPIAVAMDRGALRGESVVHLAGGTRVACNDDIKIIGGVVGHDYDRLLRLYDDVIARARHEDNTLQEPLMSPVPVMLHEFYWRRHMDASAKGK